MATVKTNEFKSGLKIIVDGNPCSIINNEHVQPGKGQAFVRVSYRNLLTGRMLEKTFKSGETIEVQKLSNWNCNIFTVTASFALYGYH